MKNLKEYVIPIVLILSIPLIINYMETSVLKYVSAIIILFFLFNIVVRKSLLFKKYLTSPYNITTTKDEYVKEVDIPKDLLFEKIIEVINDSKLNIAKSDKDTYEILATSGLNLHSWGENIYFTFESKDDKTIVKCSSVTLFQMTSWGRNKKNINRFFTQLDNSLTI